MARLELPFVLGERLRAGRKTWNPRGTAAGWAVTLLLLFGTTNLVQAFVIPTGSMQPQDEIKGLIGVRELVAPAGHFFAVGNPLVIGLDHILNLAQNFFTRTRWKRTFKLIHGYPTGS